jgi:transcriptional regulator with XRE-family HTH domain
LAKRPNQIVVTKEEIGARIKLLRQERGLTQVELGKRLDMTQPNLSAIERGARGVTVHQVVRIAKALGVSTDQILLAEKAPAPRRRPRKGLMRRIERLGELSARDQRILAQILDGLLPRGEEKRPRETSS